MPQGNHHVLPHGIWHQTPTTGSIPKLLLKSFGKFGIFLSCVYLATKYRALSINHSHKHFIGKTISLGPLTALQHEPLSVEEIDKLKAEQAERKRRQSKL